MLRKRMTMCLNETCSVRCSIVHPNLDVIGLTLEQKIPGDGISFGAELMNFEFQFLTKQIASDICNAVQKCLNDLAAEESDEI